MPITITCADGENDFTCCSGSTTNDHNFSGVLLDDSSSVQRIINPIQIARNVSSVLVWDEHGNYKDIPVTEVSGVSSVNQLSAILSQCRSVSGGIEFTREVYSGVNGTVTVAHPIPEDTDNIVVFVGGIIARIGDDYTINGQDIEWAADNTPESETVQIFIFS